MAGDLSQPEICLGRKTLIPSNGTETPILQLDGVDKAEVAKP